MKMSHNMRLIVITAFCLILISSCSKNPTCSGGDENLGIIERSIIIPCPNLNGQQNFIIDNDSVYNRTFKDSLTGQIPCTLPVIDFNLSTLLGLYADGQCEAKFIREVNQINNENKYIYRVIVKQCGACKKLISSYNWVTVPKLPHGWTVVFEKVDD
jgi:hypothetical protein